MSNKFIGCILQLKTKPDTDSKIKNIIGTVKEILENKSLLLDEAICNGSVINGVLTVGPSEIADLKVIGRVEVDPPSIKEEEPPPPAPLKPKPRRKDRMDRNTETFEINQSEIKKEFDFEESNRLFEKLPTIIKKQIPAVNVKLTEEDTTLERSRSIKSTVVKNSKSQFLTDTGIVVPGVELSLRNQILNMANDVGIGHVRQIESMSRAIVEALVSHLETWRMSPEHPEHSRPNVLILAGPHWNGAVALAAARLLSTLNVTTTVYSPQQELNFCSIEEKLYTLSKGRLVRSIPKINLTTKPNIILSGLHDHLTKFDLTSFGKFIDQNTLISLIDPPLTRYNIFGSGTNRILVFSPSLPLDYFKEKNVKHFVVNLGIPNAVFQANDVTWVGFGCGKTTVGVFKS